jgi:hypothetical protein
MLPLPISPNAPALLTALASFHPLVQTMPALDDWIADIKKFGNAVCKIQHHHQNKTKPCNKQR